MEIWTYKNREVYGQNQGYGYLFQFPGNPQKKSTGFWNRAGNPSQAKAYKPFKDAFKCLPGANS